MTQIKILTIAILVFSFHSALAQHRDAAMINEHMKMEALVNVSLVTNTALTSGRWSNRAIWSKGVPAAGARVHIPSGITVVYDLNSDVGIKTIRVDGKLTFRTNVNTKLIVDTLVATGGGELNIGIAGAPVRTGFSAQILIQDNGEIDPTWDPMRLSRGLLLHGITKMQGEAKTSFLPVTNQPHAGMRRLVLASVPKNWRVGDTVAITGVNFREPIWNGSTYVPQGTYDEVRKILAISGNIVTVRALTYDHVTAKPEWPVYLANYTRNITIATQGGVNVPTQRRGHVMFMHSDRVDVRYVAFAELGRTDKNIPVDDAQFDATTGAWIAGTGTNPRGRYAVHLHRAGTTNTYAGTPAHIQGCAVFGSPGWGFVNHESYAVIEDNASYNVLGSHYVTENGTEIGAFRKNIAILAPGSLSERADSSLACAKDGPHVANFDLGNCGHGFWLQGRLVEVSGNIVSGATNAGYEFMHRGNNRAVNWVADELLQYPEIIVMKDGFKFAGSALTSYFSYDHAPIRKFSNNTTMGSYAGLQVIKANPSQEHGQRNILDHFISMENRFGVDISYTAQYTLRDMYLLGDTHDTRGGGVGLGFGTLVSAVVVESVVVDGFQFGSDLGGGIFNDLPDIPDVKLINVQFTHLQAPYVKHGWPPVTTGLNAAYGQEELTSAQVQSHPLALVPAADQVFAGPLKVDWTDAGSFYLRSTLFDSYGQIAVTQRYSGDFLCRLPYRVAANGARMIHLNAPYFDRKTNECKLYRFKISAPGCTGGPSEWSNSVNLGPDIDPPTDTACRANFTGN